MRLLTFKCLRISDDAIRYVVLRGVGWGGLSIGGLWDQDDITGSTSPPAGWDRAASQSLVDHAVGPIVPLSVD